MLLINTSQAQSKLMLTLSLLLSLLSLSSSSHANPSQTVSSANITNKQELSFDHSHALWTEVLKQFVASNGPFSRVDYQSLKEDQKAFRQYLSLIESVKRKEFEAFTQEQQLAFLINYYNAHQVQQVVDNYPLDSIRDLGFLFSTPWKKEFFTLFGEASSLDMIEHEMIRKLFKEPRIHFAVNCASIGCPPLLHQAYQAEQLQQQLEHVSNTFLNATSLNHFSKATNTLTLSPIFKWYQSDFGNEEALQKFVARYMANFTFDKALAEIEYSDYDWNLNDTKTLN